MGLFTLYCFDYGCKLLKATEAVEKSKFIRHSNSSSFEYHRMGRFAGIPYKTEAKY